MVSKRVSGVAGGFGGEGGRGGSGEGLHTSWHDWHDGTIWSRWHSSLGCCVLKQDSANRRLGNAASASSISFRIKENAKSNSWQGFPNRLFCG